MKITKYAQACILIETNGKRILIDPGYLEYTESLLDEWKDIDILLVTHKHRDHCHLPAIQEILKDLDMNIRNELYYLWHEFEENETYEAKFINALDKLEAQLQQNKIQDIKSLIDLENNNIFKKIESCFKFDSFIENFKNEILQEAFKIRTSKNEK